jgi:glycosyltransferase involved in cell wall biosynthesis
LKILQISSAQSLGGGERHLADLANGLAGRGHEVHVVLRPNSPLIEQLADLPNTNITTLPLRNAFDANSARDLSALVRKNQIQILHAHMARDYPLAAYAVRQNPTTRLIVTRHVLFPLNRLHRFTLSKAARVIAVSHAVASQLRDSGIATPEKITVVQNGIDVAKFADAGVKFDRRRFLQSWQLPEDCLLVGTVGELSPLKGQQEFLQAAARVVDAQYNAYFIIAGMDHSNTNRNRLDVEARIHQLGLAGRVKLVSWLPDIEQLYCALNVFVSASHSESFGLAIVEAMACSTAVVATETEGAREIIQAGETGMLIRIGDVEMLGKTLTELLGDEDRRVQMGQAAQRSVAKRFSVERMIGETEEIYRTELHKNLREADAPGN